MSASSDPGVLRARIAGGSYTPVITPYRDGEVDFETFERLVDRQAQVGSAGVVVTGTTGEPTSLTPQERSELFRRAVDAASGRLQVVAATGAIDQPTTMTLTAAAVDAGADAVLVVAPGFVKPSQRGLRDHFVAVAERTELPVLLYNIPGRAAVSIEADTVEQVVEQRPNVVGVKHASFDLDYLTQLLLSLGDDFHLFCGTETMSYPMLAVGGSGLMSAVGNLLPGKVNALCDAVRQGRHDVALSLHRELFAVNRAIFFDTNPVPLKLMMEAWGLASAEVRPPLVSVDDAVRARVLAVLAQYQPEETVVPSVA